MKGAQAAIKRIKRQRREENPGWSPNTKSRKEQERQKKLFEIAKKKELYKHGK